MIIIYIYIVGKQHCCRKSALSVLAVKAVLAQAWFVCSYALCRSFLNQTSVIGYSQEYLPLHFLKLTSLHFWGPTDQELPKAILFTRLQDSAPKKIGMQQWSASKVDFWAFLTTVLHLLSQCEGLLHDAWCMLWWNLGKRTWVTWSPQIKAFAPQFQLIQLWMLSDKSENNLQTTSNIFKPVKHWMFLDVFQTPWHLGHSTISPIRISTTAGLEEHDAILRCRGVVSMNRSREKCTSVCTSSHSAQFALQPILSCGRAPKHASLVQATSKNIHMWLRGLKKKIYASQCKL